MLVVMFTFCLKTMIFSTGASELVTRWTRHRWRVHCCVFSLLWQVHHVTTSLWRVIRLMSTLLYISCRCAVSVFSCCCVLMAYTRKPILGWFFRYYFMSHLRLKCIKFDFDWGSALDPTGGAYICSVAQDHLDLSGSTSKGREGKERERRGTDAGRREGRRRGGKEMGMNGPPEFKTWMRQCQQCMNECFVLLTRSLLWRVHCLVFVRLWRVHRVTTVTSSLLWRVHRVTSSLVTLR